MLSDNKSGNIISTGFKEGVINND